MTTKAQVLMLKPIGGTIAMPIEVHVDADDAWWGYNLANPFGGMRMYRKDRYEVVGV